MYLGHGLRCQTCSGGDYKCEGENDDGQSIECPAWSTSCVYANYYGAYEGGNPFDSFWGVKSNYRFAFRGPHNSSVFIHRRWL